MHESEGMIIQQGMQLQHFVHLGCHLLGQRSTGHVDVELEVGWLVGGGGGGRLRDVSLHIGLNQIDYSYKC